MTNHVYTIDDGTGRIEARSWLDQSGLKTELESLQKSVEDIRQRLNTRDHSSDTRTIAGRIRRISRKEKEEREINMLLDDLADIKLSASVLSRILSMSVFRFAHVAVGICSLNRHFGSRVQDLQRRGDSMMPCPEYSAGILICHYRRR